MKTMATASKVNAASKVLSGVRREHVYNRFPKTNVTKEQILKFAKDNAVQYVDMQFTDMFGVLKAVTIPVHKLEDAIDHNVWFDGSSIDGFTRIMEADMYLTPDLDTFAVLPWTADGEDITARLICDVFLPDGSAFTGCPRYILKQQLKRAEKLGLVFNTGAEPEFFLFETDETGKPMPLAHDNAGYFDQTTDLALQIRRHMAFDLEEMGIEIEALHHEVAPGQHEINFKYADALRTADNIQSLKLTLKAVAQRIGVHATFMPKPFFGENGSGMHVHQSLASIEDGVNKFYEEGGVYNLSPLAESFVAGQFAHVKAMNAIMNPIVNSYKRLVVGYEAPVNVAWGQQNRSALIRVPRLSPSQAKRGARIEFRCADPASNPYLTMAVMLAAGLDGIEKGLKAPAPIEENIWALTDEEMSAQGIDTVAGSLGEALDALEKDNIIMAALGKHTTKLYLKAKRKELEDYNMSVTDWEMKKYINC
jgi:glutamine synthetase